VKYKRGKHKLPDKVEKIIEDIESELPDEVETISLFKRLKRTKTRG
jgi:hypothetical protein